MLQILKVYDFKGQQSSVGHEQVLLLASPPETKRGRPSSRRGRWSQRSHLLVVYPRPVGSGKRCRRQVMIHSPDSRPVRPDPPTLEVLPQPNSIAAASVRGQTAGVPVRDSRTR